MGATLNCVAPTWRKTMAQGETISVNEIRLKVLKQQEAAKNFKFSYETKVYDLSRAPYTEKNSPYTIMRGDVYFSGAKFRMEQKIFKNQSVLTSESTRALNSAGEVTALETVYRGNTQPPSMSGTKMLDGGKNVAPMFSPSWFTDIPSFGSLKGLLSALGTEKVEVSYKSDTIIVVSSTSSENDIKEEYYLDPSQQFRLFKSVLSANGQILIDYECEKFISLPGASHIPMSATMRTFGPKGKEVARLKVVVDEDSINSNVPVEDSFYVVAFPSGAYVVDDIAGVRYESGLRDKIDKMINSVDVLSSDLSGTPVRLLSGKEPDATRSSDQSFSQKVEIVSEQKNQISAEQNDQFQGPLVIYGVVALALIVIFSLCVRHYLRGTKKRTVQ